MTFFVCCCKKKATARKDNIQPLPIAIPLKETGQKRDSFPPQSLSVMEQFYKNFLKKNSEENAIFQAAENENFHGDGTDSNSESDSDIKDPTKIVFQNEDLKLVVVKSQLQRQINFKLG